MSLRLKDMYFGSMAQSHATDIFVALMAPKLIFKKTKKSVEFLPEKKLSLYLVHLVVST
jgi:hypothetical protein